MAYDKKLHLCAGFVIAVAFGFILDNAAYGFAVAALAGLFKEVIDWFVYRGFDPKDAVATWIGGLLGYMAYMAMKGVL